MMIQWMKRQNDTAKLVHSTIQGGTMLLVGWHNNVDTKVT